MYIGTECVRVFHHDPITVRSQKVESDLDRPVPSSTAERSFVTGPHIVSVVFEGNIVPRESIRPF